jgi:NADH-quinone oxidoreductase subunit L
MQLNAALLCIFAPLIGSALTPLFAKIHPKLRDAWAVLAALTAAGAALSLLPGILHPESFPVEYAYTWLTDPFAISFGILLDPVSIVVVNVVAVVSAVIMLYVVGYMMGDPGQTRFWMWMNAFIGSMVLLVLSNNLLFLFVGWKLVGVCSFGLIGYYYQDEKKYWLGGPPPTPYVTPSKACIKALLVTGVGDMLMLAGILIMFYYSGTLNILELYNTVGEWLPKMAEYPGMIILVSILLLAGPAGKSAQFPLHEWLPEAMAGPGPVSALIHAATMVKSGVYLVARLLPLFYYGRYVLNLEDTAVFFQITAWMGAITAFMAATQGMVALELKKVLAYSTVSQIGYMMLALGVAGMSKTLLVEGFTAGLFHLVSHAMFKACLFLCAGTIIHMVHSFYITDMGGMKKYMKLTWVFMGIAALSLIGFPYITPGFWSKDLVLLATLSADMPLFIFALVTVGLTAFYTTRFFGLVFHGKESENVVHAKEHGGHMNDGHVTQAIACGILAVMIAAAGIFGKTLEHTLAHGFEYTLTKTLHLPVEEAATHAPHWLIPVLSIVFLLLGVIPGYILFFRRNISVHDLVVNNRLLKGAHTFLWKRWFIDGFYLKVFVTGTFKLANFVAFKLEDNFDKLVHKTLPSLVTQRGPAALVRLRADGHETMYAVGYILILLCVCIAVFFSAAGVW